MKKICVYRRIPYRRSPSFTIRFLTVVSLEEAAHVCGDEVRVVVGEGEPPQRGSQRPPHHEHVPKGELALAAGPVLAPTHPNQTMNETATNTNPMSSNE
jgi:hypothetical protein